MNELVTRSDARLGIWREAPCFKEARTAALGAFACDSAEAGADLLLETVSRLKAEGFEAVLGPMDGDTWAAHRLVIESDGSVPFLMEPRNAVHDVAAFEAANFRVVSRYVSALRPADTPTRRGEAPDWVRIRAFDKAEAERELRAIHALSLEAFAGNAFYKPISVQRFLDAYLPLVPMFDAELTLIAEDEDGALIGFLFGVPNYAEGAAPRSVILKTYASMCKGVGGALAAAFHERARARGFAQVIHALMHERNISARHSESLGAHVFRRYALFGRML